MTETLFEHASRVPIAHARVADPETSHAAAAVITPHLTMLQMAVAEAWRAKGVMGATDLEVTAEIGKVELSTIRSRRAELRDMNIIIKTDMRRPTGDSPLDRIVWRHRDHHPNPPPIKSPQPPVTKQERADGRAMAAELEAGAEQLRSEGRTGFADQLIEAARLMRRLAR